MDGSSLEKIEKFKLPIALSLLGIVLIIGGIFASGLNKQSASWRTKDFPKESLIQSQTPKIISIDVSGAVKTPGVYQLNAESRIEDAIRMAGGFSESANQEYISKYLNLAQKLSDGSKVYVPVIGENPPAGGGSGAIVGNSTQSKVNVNSSSQVEIETLPGIGPVTASKIISGRPYQVVEDLLNKKVVSKSVFEKIKDQIVVY